MISLGTLWSKFFIRLRGKAIRNSQIDKTSKIFYGCNIVGSSFGRYSYCGGDCWIINTEVGNFCSIGTNVRIGGAAHPIDWVSTSPVFHSGRNILNHHFAEIPFEVGKKTVIGNDVWIADGVFVKAGIQIGDGAVIGMGSVVTHDVGAYEIWAGNPAKKIRNRFDEKLFSKMEESQWWDLPDSELEKIANQFDDIEKTIQKVRAFKEKE